jgi:putative acetyltransferase
MPAFTIHHAQTPAHIDAFRALCTEYQASLPYSLDFQGFDEEMAALPGKYAPPRGRMYVALAADDHRPVGCAAIREIEPNVAELKRMYVIPDYRGRGVARAIASQLIKDARAIGHHQMKLDTSGDMYSAQALYRSLGFLPTDRYNDDPMEDTLYFALKL